jgi:hypothetical protein
VRHLSRLTPAETLIVKSGDTTPLKDLLKYTLMDLLLKQVLIIEEVQRQPSLRDPIRMYKYIMVGKNFGAYLVRPHEIVFLSVFQKNPKLKIVFKNLVKVAYQNAKSERLYYPFLTTNINLKDSFNTTIYHRLFGGFTYTDKGVKLKNEVQNEITELEKTFPDDISRDKKRGLETLKLIGGNIFLLDGLDFAITKEIDKELFQEVSTYNTYSEWGSGGWTSFDNYSDSFDNSCSSDTGHGGDSGDSGCSSGCGGCGGGCGGD